MGWLRNYIENKLVRLYKPRMINGYKRFDGVFLPNVRISNTTFIDHSKNLKIDDDVFIGHHNFLEASNGIEIEEGVQITNFVSIVTHSSHNAIRLYGKSYSSTKAELAYLKGKVCIGKFSFIGPHVTIMPKTNIGKGCIVSAYSYVSGDFPDFSIIKGNPAVIVGNTRENDAKFLANNPEFQSLYKEWAD